jgi:hypothetical protein
MTRQEQTAITNLYSQVVLIRGNDCFDDDGNSVEINQSLVDEEVARLQAEYEAEQIQIEADKASAVSKLEALGLTDAELKALSGGL